MRNNPAFLVVSPIIAHIVLLCIPTTPFADRHVWARTQQRFKLKENHLIVRQPSNSPEAYLMSSSQ